MDVGTIQTLVVSFAGGFGLIAMSRGFLKGPAWLSTDSGKLFALIAGAVLICGGLYAAQRESDPDAHALVEEARGTMQLPMTVDAETRLDDVVAVGPREIAYHYTLTSIRSADLDDAVRTSAHDELRSLACANTSLHRLLGRGFEVSLVYRTQDAVELTRVHLAADACK